MVLLKWILFGPLSSKITKLQTTREMENILKVTSQFIAQNVKTTRQTNYHLLQQNQTLSSMIETPLNVGSGIAFYHATRSKKLVDFLSDLNMSASYKKVLDIKEHIAQSVLKRYFVNDGVFIPLNIMEDLPCWFAIDNSDLKIDTPDGKRQHHGTAIVVYQRKTKLEPVMQERFDRKSIGCEKLKLKAYTYTCLEPAKSSRKFPSYTKCVENESIINLNKMNDTVWFVLKMLSPTLGKAVPTWAAYNSLVSKGKAITTVSMLPIINGSPTDWNNLYTAIKEAEKVRKRIYKNGKTIISFDLQLYIKAIRLQERVDIDNFFVFRIGELHVVFCVLKCLGKLIDGSGLDKAFHEAGIYGLPTVDQIKDGKHLYRSLEAYFALYLAIFSRYMDCFINKNQAIERDLRAVVVHSISEVSAYSSSNKIKIEKAHDSIQDVLTKIDFAKLQKDFDTTLVNQSKYMRSFMRLFEVLLLFIRASRDQLWNLHLQTLHSLCPYFFAFDMLNYARMTPVYLSQMFALEKADKETWELLSNGGFCINKSHVPFSSIGADHGIEQENRALKVIGGIRGIAHNQQALDEYFLTTAEMGNLVETFCETFGIEEDGARKRDEHYQLSGSKNVRVSSNTEKISRVLDEHEVVFSTKETTPNQSNEDNTEADSFGDGGDVFNILTKKVLPVKISKSLIQIEEIGQSRYRSFLTEKLEGDGSIWDTIKKQKLGTFVSNNKSSTVTIDNQQFTIREERKLMNRLLVASRSRPDIDLRECLGKYEFTVTPPSLFFPDGTLHPTKDKSVIADELYKLQDDKTDERMDMVEQPDQPESDLEEVVRKVAIVDGMAVVNRVDIKKRNIRSCADFASSFIEIIDNDTADFDEVRIIFDEYRSKSLKNSTRANRTKGCSSVHYKVTDSTRIEHLSTKEFLSSIETKQELTQYLSLKLSEHLVKDFVIVFKETVFSNIPDLNQELFIYNHEEADTAIVLHAIDASARKDFIELVILCSDTDVLLILLHYFDRISSTTIFKTINKEFVLREIHERLSPEICKGLLGFHAMSGCDQTGKFLGYTKSSCWEIYSSLPEDELKAFADLGSTDLSPSTFESLEMFVVRLYCRNKVPKEVKNLSDLRWRMFTKQQADSSKLPPTSEALRQKILRCHYTVTVWKQSHISSQSLPDPTNYGWNDVVDDDLFEPVTTALLPAPKSIIQLTVCACKTTKCVDRRCKCHKNGLKCSEMCQCSDCENNINNGLDSHDIDDDLES
ncbi:uncharacterized protein [Clytia hemisphaerica]|uniref:uncharacterized protein n=1 Tax=Clytia hemisphaerica TaxID=252671 RepID=UPI0034D7381E